MKILFPGLVALSLAAGVAPFIVNKPQPAEHEVTNRPNQVVQADYTSSNGTQACSSCHIDDKKIQGKVSVKLETNPMWQSLNGQRAYQPGKTYEMAVTLAAPHEIAGLALPAQTALLFHEEGAILCAVFGGKRIPFEHGRWQLDRAEACD